MFHFSQSAFHVYNNKLHELRKVFQLLCLVMTLLAQGHRSSLCLFWRAQEIRLDGRGPWRLIQLPSALGIKMAVLYNWMIFFFSFLFLLDFLVLLAGKVTSSRWSRRCSWFPNESDIFQMVRDQSRLQKGSPGSEITEILLSSLAAVTKKGHLPKQSLRHIAHQVTAGLPHPEPPVPQCTHLSRFCGPPSLPHPMSQLLPVAVLWGKTNRTVDF